jgi:sulfatase modifying factor 1
LIGVQDRPAWYEVDPYGMNYIPMGSYVMGPSDQDVPYAQWHKSKTVSVQAFYIDQTEITNNEYRQFVFYVRTPSPSAPGRRGHRGAYAHGG